MESDEQCFDNWEEMAEEIEKQKVQTNVQQKEVAPIVEEKVSDSPKKKTQKQILAQKLQWVKNLKQNEFSKVVDDMATCEDHTSTLNSNRALILTSDKDFKKYAHNVASRFKEQISDETKTLDDEKLTLFFQELHQYLYKSLTWNNLHEENNKLKVVKRDRKTLEGQIAKLKKKKVGEDSSEMNSKSQKIVEKDPEDDLFGGVAMINSHQAQKEKQDQFKAEKKQQPAKQDKKEVPKPAADDDEQFW